MYQRRGSRPWDAGSKHIPDRLKANIIDVVVNKVRSPMETYVYNHGHHGGGSPSGSSAESHDR
jgi:hypothetical protein